MVVAFLCIGGKRFNANAWNIFRTVQKQKIAMFRKSFQDNSGIFWKK